jgi:hypothetical protein
MLTRTKLSFALPWLLALGCASAQERPASRADLRYTSPMPAKVSYLTVDSMQMLNTGLPTGDMTVNASVRSIVDIDITAAPAGVHMKAMLREFEGNVETPMGSMPFPDAAKAGTSTEFNVGIRGLDLKQSYEDAKQAGVPSSMDVNALLGRSREIAPLLLLPGREVALKESWTDTVTHADSIEGVAFTVHMIVRGTYEGDTVVEGRTLNVLAFRNEMKMTSNGVVQGMAMQQITSTSSTERALWDSSQHLLISNHASAEMKMDMSLPGMGNMTMTGTIKSLKQKTE